ncbi:MAG: 3-hydroxyacyl-CoA dehydrogenase family protein, partial [Deltaproteobacteria bacterium]|nr:3-hydroxyacyl-CoA dehydrogenase family protein [Deltaproteobacteria bacterium]
MGKVKIEKVAVIGAGVMGQGIAAHLANAGIPSVLLDIVPRDLKDEEKENPQARSRIAIGAIESLKKAKPALLLVDRFAELIQPGNIEDDLNLLYDCDWVVEAVIENLDIKRNLFQKILPFRKFGAVVTSNTSGISIARMVEGFPEDFRRNFFVTHFFNPVRYMKLLEIVVGKETDSEVVDSLVDFGRNVLGKGIVYGKDTPNFVANRIGVYGLMKAIQVMVEDGLTVEEIDAIAGPPMGRPKSAAFKTCDLVGLDTFAHVAKNVYDNLPDDDERSVFIMPGFIVKMI